MFLLAVLLSLRLVPLQRDRVKQSHLTVSLPVLRTTRCTNVCQRTHADHSQIVKWLLLASPFLALRTAYGMLGIFDATSTNMITSMWSSLFGLATAFALMALFPEYIVVCIYVYILRFRVSKCREMIQLLGEGRDTGGHEMGAARNNRIGE